MIKLLFVLEVLLLTFTLYGQKKNSVDIDIIGRYDKHAEYTTRFGSRSYTNDTKLWGKSFGFNFSFNRAVCKHIKAKIGVGYYNLGIDKILQTTPFNFIASGRNINYRHPSGILPLFATKKYNYNNLNFTLALVYERSLVRTLSIIAEGNLDYLFSFSQLYHITYDNIRYRTNNSRTLGFQVNSYLGILKSFNNDKNYLSPRIIIPVYQRLQGDQVFGEDESVKMDKWLHGIGLCFAIGKYF